jgi:deoxyribonuclease-4
MPILGAHESIAGGYYKSAEIARRVGCDCVQLFTMSRPTWLPRISSQFSVSTV